MVFDLLIYATKKNPSGRWTVPSTGHKKGGGIQGISTASTARVEMLSDALGTRLAKPTKMPSVFGGRGLTM